MNPRAGDTLAFEDPPELTQRLAIKPRRDVGIALAQGRTSELGRTGVIIGTPIAAGLEVLEFEEPVTLEEAQEIARQLVRDGLAEEAEPEYNLSIAEPSVDDPLYSAQWHLHGRPTVWPGEGATYGIDVESAWGTTQGSADVVVAVLDTGVTQHVDLVDRLVPGYDFIDNVAGGYDPGDYREQDQCPAPNDDAKPRSSWHGVHVAGTIGASTDNGVGLAGVDRNARIQSVRVLGPCGGSSFTVANGIYWAAGAGTDKLPPGVPVNPNPAQVLNLSLGSSRKASCGSTFQNAIDYAVGEGVVVVAAAGNKSDAASDYALANCDNIVTVAATSPIGDRAGYSNFGTAVDIAAPGGDNSFGSAGMVASLGNAGQTDPAGDDYVYNQGTSMAAPHVAGVVSLILGVDPTLDPGAVLNILRSTAQPFPVTPDPDYRCSDDPSATFHCGAGIVDAGAAVTEASVPRPTLSATPGLGEVELEWTASDAIAGPATYELFQAPGATCTDADEEVYSGPDTTFLAADLTPKAMYWFCVRAVDTTGLASLMSVAVDAMPTSEPPPAPAWLDAVPGEAKVDLTWDVVPEAASYELFQTHGATSCSDAGAVIYDQAGTSHTATGLTPDLTYRYCVRALDSFGTPSELSDSAEAVPTFPPAPSAPGGLSATAGIEQVSVSWNPAAGADEYELFRSTGSTSCTSGTRFTRSGASSSVTHTGLQAGTRYNYCIRSVDVYGQASGFSPQRSARPTAPPPAPPSWSSGSKSGFDLISGGVRLSWPKASGTVSRYRVQRNGSTIATTTSLSRNVSGLNNGQRYQLRVRGENSGGASPWLTLHVSPTAGFRDVSSASAFRNDIRWLATAEITRGCNPPTNDRFCPGSVVTREQMAAFMVRSLGLTYTSSRGNFSDVPASDPFRADINRLATAGITMGCNPPANTRFCPDRPVTRGQMAAFLTRALDLRATSSNGTFVDVPAGHTFRADINRLATARITMGCNPPTNSRYCPDRTVTREQMAAFLRRGLSG